MSAYRLYECTVYKAFIFYNIGTIYTTQTRDESEIMNMFFEIDLNVTDNNYMRNIYLQLTESLSFMWNFSIYQTFSLKLH